MNNRQYTVLNKDNNNKSNLSIYKQVFTTHRFMEINKQLDNFDWLYLINNNNPNETAQHLTSFFKYLVDLCFSLQLDINRQNKLNWFTDHLKCTGDKLISIKTILNHIKDIVDKRAYHFIKAAYKEYIIKTKKMTYDNLILNPKNRDAIYREFICN